MVYQRHDNSLAFDQDCIKEGLCFDYVYVIMNERKKQQQQQKNVLIPSIYFANYSKSKNMSVGTVHPHYANTPMQYTAIFHGCKKCSFSDDFLKWFSFFAQNINCGYTLEPHQ